MSADLGQTSRRLRDLVEPVAAGIYFAPEAHAGYEALGLVSGDTLTDAGRRLRGDVERATDQAEHEVIERLGDRTDELFALLAPWSQAIVAANGYPSDPSTLPEIRS